MRHVRVGIGDEARQFDVGGDTELGGQRQQRLAATAATEDQQPARTFRPQPCESPDQRREILALAEFAHAEDQRWLARGEPGVIGACRARLDQPRRHHRARYHLDVLARQPGIRGHVVGDAARGHDHAVRMPIEPAHRGALQPALIGTAARQVNRHRGADAQHQPRRNARDRARKQRRAVEAVLVGEHRRRAFTPQVAHQRRQARIDVARAEVDHAHASRHRVEVRTVTAHPQQVDTKAARGQRRDQVLHRAIDAAVARGRDEHGKVGPRRRGHKG